MGGVVFWGGLGDEQSFFDLNLLGDVFWMFVGSRLWGVHYFDFFFQRCFFVVAFQELQGSGGVQQQRSDMTSAHLQGKTPNVGTLERGEDFGWGNVLLFGDKLNRLNPSLETETVPTKMEGK